MPRLPVSARRAIEPVTANRVRMVVNLPLVESRSEGVLDPRDDEILGFAVARGGATGERGVLVVGHDLDGLGQIPVEADGPRLGPAGGARRVGVGGEGGVVDAELA